MVSGSISPPYSGYFSPFPHGTSSLSVSQEYLALPDGAGRFRRDFSGPALLRIPLSILTLPVRDSHPLWSTFPDSSCSVSMKYRSPTTPNSRNYQGLGSSRSLATTWGITIVFSSSGYLDVSVPRVRLPPYDGISRLQRDGLPHSEIYGSNRVCQSPQLIAAYHVLHRL